MLVSQSFSSSRLDRGILGRDAKKGIFDSRKWKTSKPAVFENSLFYLDQAGAPFGREIMKA
jgi:hypothetical protein